MTMINDTFGYEAADTVLIEIGRRLDTCLGSATMIGRLGGDRFGMILSHCPPEHVAAAAEKILAAVNAAAGDDRARAGLADRVDRQRLVSRSGARPPTT